MKFFGKKSSLNFERDVIEESEVQLMNKYKLFIRKYNFMKKDYEVIERVVVTNDIYIS